MSHLDEHGTCKFTHESAMRELNRALDALETAVNNLPPCPYGGELPWACDCPACEATDVLDGCRPEMATIPTDTGDTP